MTKTAEQRTLADRLQPRLDREEQFIRTGRRLRNKSLLFKYERYWIRPLLRAGLTVTGLYGTGKRNALNPVVRRLSIEFPNLPAAFDGYTVLHISDLHIDGVPGLSEALTNLLPTLEPDLILVTGDYRFEDHGPCDAIYPAMEPVIGSMRARDGAFGILGNHDVAEIALRLDQMGLRMLVNEAVEIRCGYQSIWIGGIDDPFDYRCDDLPGTFASVPQDAFKILMAHTPELYQQAFEQNVALYLCGHTHAGQIRFPLVGSLRNNASCPRPYAYGHWTYQSLHGHTSAGIGCSALPIRFGCPPEVTLIELRHPSE